MLNNKQIILGLLALVVLASGCTDSNNTEVTVTQNTGVSIQEFNAFPSDVTEGQDTQVTLTLRNTGGAEATNVNAELFNIPFGSGSGGWSNDPGTISFGALTPPDPDQGIPSSPRPQTFSITAPNFEESVTVPYDIRSRVWFDYSTTATSRVTLMGQQRFRDTGAQRTKPEVDNTGGPIQMEVRTRSPIVFYEGTGGGVQDTSTQLCVIVRNTGDGTPYLQGTDLTNSDNSNKVELTLRSSQFSLTATDDNEVEMVSGRGVNCYNFDSLDSVDSNTQIEVPITITADYTYEKEASTAVTVEGRGN